MYFIENQTNWYKQKASALNKVKLKLWNEYPEGKVKLYRTKMLAIQKMESISNLALAFSKAFSNPEQLHLIENHERVINSTIQLLKIQLTKSL